MNSRTDRQLLIDYAENRSEAAFAELVRRHIDFVYSAALRMVRNTHLAEDVTQGVFVAAAQNARQLVDCSVLPGWLHRTAQNLAANAVRSDVRRRAREEEAAVMNELLAANPDASWEHIAPHLDDALGELSDPDRDAVLLRYFKNHDLRTVGATLGISDDAAQKRVSRAVERLREFFAKRGVTVGASGLAVVISANAVQAAPVGLTLTISTAAALMGTTLATTATATAIKTIAMTALQKTIVAATIAVLAGTGIYEARQAAQLREQAQTLQQQQAPLSKHIAELNQALIDATNQLAALRDDSERLGRNSAELLKLRSEVGMLRNTARASMQANPSDSSTEAAAKSWLNRAKQLKQYAEENPEEKIPEFQFLTDREWLLMSGDTGLETEDFRAKDDYRRGMELLRSQAESRFGNHIQAALNKYASANNNQFPTEVAQLKPYCEPAVLETLQQLYEIKPVDILPASVVKDFNVKVEWVITRKMRVNLNSTSRLAVFIHGNAYWQSRPGTD